MSSKMFDDVLTASKYKVLYAEDEQGVRDVYGTFFKDYFKEVIIAENGDDAWRLFQSEKPDVVVLDILMPGLNGVEVAKNIRKISKDTIIIIMTANDTKEWLLSSVELGLAKFIKKGTIKFTEFENLILEITKGLDSENKAEENESLWVISPKESGMELVWDLTKHKMYKDGVVVPLSKKPTQLINYFAHNKDRIISYDELAKELWDDEDAGNKKTSSKQKIRTFLYQIKNNLGVDIFQSHYNQGYVVKL